MLLSNSKCSGKKVEITRQCCKLKCRISAVNNRDIRHFKDHLTRSLQGDLKPTKVPISVAAN